MSNHNARVLRLLTDTDVVREMRLVDAEEGGIRHMLPKARHYLVKLEKVPRPIVHILKETFLSCGGDAVVSHDIITAAVTHSDVILSGTRKHFQRAFLNLLEQGFGCDALAAEIESAMRHYDSAANTPDPSVTTDQRLASFFRKLGNQTLVMGILNVTPDSFSDGGSYADTRSAIEHGVRMASDGADIIDVGGESTRPGSDAVSSEDEMARVVPVIRELAASTSLPISIDTTKADVARAALEAGASMVNDISAGVFDARMPELIAQRHCPAILMHIQGTPTDMQVSPTYTDLMGEICAFLRERVHAIMEAGGDEKLLIVDPGIGFGKAVEHNLEILRRLRELKSIGRPIAIGTSRKSTIGKVLGDLPVDDRLEGTAATVAISIMNGADIVRVHDVKEMARVARMTDAIARLTPLPKQTSDTGG